MAKNKINAKEVGLAVLLGSLVVIFTPIIAGLFQGLEFLSFEIIPGVISIGAAISAGIVALLADMGITAWLRK